jgi:ribonuclease J
MRLRIHRGTAEIGGNCIEVEAQGKSILLDLGMPLSGNLPPSEVLPPVPGLLDGTNPSLIGIVISHPHSDHYGLVCHAHPSIPVYIGMEAEKLLRASSAFSSFGLQLANAVHYRPGARLSIGPFTITPTSSTIQRSMPTRC